MDLKKRTSEQIRYSVEVEKDFTGGYQFLAWLIWMRAGVTSFIVLFTIAVIIYGLYTNYWISLISLLLCSLIGLIFYNEYDKDKKGIAR